MKVKIHTSSKLPTNFTLTPEYPDDIYKIYNLIEKGDIISGKTNRKIEINGKQIKTNIFIKISVSKIETDLSTNNIFFSGPILNENEHVRKGSNHTFNITLNSIFNIEKVEWNNLNIKTFKNLNQRNEILFFICRFKIVDIFSVTENFIKCVGSEKKLNLKRFNKDSNVIVVDVDGINSSLKSYFVKTTVFKFPRLMTNKDIINSILNDPKNKFFSVQEDLREMEKFLKSDAYGIIGFSEIYEALDYGAVKSIILTNSLYKSFDITKRKEIEILENRVKKANGNVYVLPHTHDLGKKLEELGGIVGILKFLYK